nr:HPr family phosphocarrier protein [uncultured Caproiciproducens sp.]
MKKFTYQITDAQGIHARPAGLLTQEAKQFSSSVKICKGSVESDAKRIFSIMGLAAKPGETVSVIVEGEDEGKAAAALEAFFKKNL